MVRNPNRLRDFERELLRASPIDIQRNFRIMASLYDEAVNLQIFPLDNPLEGIERDIRYAKVINSVSDDS
jgi:hypothetical protein